MGGLGRVGSRCQLTPVSGQFHAQGGLHYVGIRSAWDEDSKRKQGVNFESRVHGIGHTHWVMDDGMVDDDW